MIVQTLYTNDRTFRLGWRHQLLLIYAFFLPYILWLDVHYYGVSLSASHYSAHSSQLIVEFPMMVADVRTFACQDLST
jgi:hypothetical protein